LSDLAHDPSRDERRRGPRTAFAAGPSVYFLVKPSFQLRGGTVADVSAEGVSLLVGRPLEPNTALAFQLRDIELSRRLIFRAEVRHVRVLPDGGWLVGCCLSRPLGASELALFQEAGLVPMESDVELTDE
jgi:hypothetical protein